MSFSPDNTQKGKGDGYPESREELVELVKRLEVQLLIAKQIAEDEITRADEAEERFSAMTPSALMQFVSHRDRQQLSHENINAVLRALSLALEDSGA